MKSVHRLAKALARTPARTPAMPSTPMGGSLGIVTARNSDGTVSLSINGGTGVPANVLGTYVNPQVNDITVVLTIGTQLWAIGPTTPVTAWTPFGVTGSGATISLAANWASFGVGFFAPAYRLLGDMLQLRGVAQASAAISTGAPVTEPFPASMRPKASVALSTLSSAGATDLQVPSSGTSSAQLITQTAIANTGVLFLDNLSWSVS